MRILVVVVTYNGRQWIDRCLSSISDSTINVDTYVIDNCSTDDTCEYVSRNYKQVHIVQSDVNLGFARANNMGMRYALDNGYDYVFLLNQDAWVEKDTFEKLLKTFDDNENVGIASPVHLNGSHTTLDFGFASYMQRDFVMDLYACNIKPYYQVPFMNAAAWMLPRKTLETVGGFDTLLFSHYEEDVNYCQRIRYHGLKIMVNTECLVCHDREQRDYSSYEGRTLWKDENKYSFVKVDWGDINKPLDIKSKKRKNRIRLILYFLLLKRVQAKSVREENELLTQISKSRDVNKQVSPSWLWLQ